MKHPRRRAPARPTIWLIAEDRTGSYVFETIIQKRGILAAVRPVGSAKGLPVLARELEGLLRETLRDKAPQDCIVVLHDTDESVERYRKHYKTITDICKRYEAHVTRLWATEEIEAWLLADDGFCAWLGDIPKACDHLPKPSLELESRINKRFGKRMWNDLHKPRLIQHMTATGDKPGRSVSMREAMQTLLELPCTQAR